MDLRHLWTWITKKNVNNVKKKKQQKLGKKYKRRKFSQNWALVLVWNSQDLACICIPIKISLHIMPTCNNF